MSTLDQHDENVKVVVRCRPLTKNEVDNELSSVVDVNTEEGSVSIHMPDTDINETTKTFIFDHVYDGNESQQQFYDETARPIVESVLQGYNGTIITYGQTGAGKRYTMEGNHESWDGIIPNAVQHIFDSVRCSLANGSHVLVRVSSLDVYLEQIYDMLATEEQKTPLTMRETPDGTVYVQNLTSVEVRDVSEMNQALEFVRQNRPCRPTEMGVSHALSRTHRVLTITIETMEGGCIKVGKLSFVRMAGSERQCKTGVPERRLQEAVKIGLSLSAMGNVICALTSGKTKHIPYRDSKITRLLKDSLGGTAKTLMITNIIPADRNYDETLSSLRYGNRCKGITNRVRVHLDPHDEVLQQYKEGIAMLQQQLSQKTQ
eukprot:GFYU01001583.1.p1 GENE.GFYU01001583.1~~GFYU01001583.1.p1  ORF type:complete len:374 (-),score=82.77 GFYU01001583.1:118-1239(-)